MESRRLLDVDQQVNVTLFRKDGRAVFEGRLDIGVDVEAFQRICDMAGDAEELLEGVRRVQLPGSWPEEGAADAVQKSGSGVGRALDTNGVEAKQGMLVLRDLRGVRTPAGCIRATRRLRQQFRQAFIRAFEAPSDARLIAGSLLLCLAHFRRARRHAGRCSS
jgi:hypothetical protein